MVDNSSAEVEETVKSWEANNKVITVRLPANKREELKKLAEKMGISCNELCRQTLLNLLDSEP